MQPPVGAPGEIGQYQVDLEMDLAMVWNMRVQGQAVQVIDFVSLSNPGMWSTFKCN